MDDKQKLDEALRALHERFPPGYEGPIIHPDVPEDELVRRAWAKYRAANPHAFH